MNSDFFLPKDVSKVLTNFEKSILLKTDTNLICNELNKLSVELNWSEIINSHLEKLLNNKYHIPFNSTKSKIVILDCESYELSLFYNPPKPLSFEGKFMYSYVNDIFYCPLIDIPNFKYSIFEQTNIKDYSTIDNSSKLELKNDNELITKGKSIFLRKFKDVLKLDKTKTFFCLALVSKIDLLNYSWEYNSKTLMPNRIVSANINFSRLSTTTKILSQIGDSRSRKLLEELCEHKSHFVRWDALKSLINLNKETGIKILKKMKNDKHIEVRNAANMSLNILNIK